MHNSRSSLLILFGGESSEHEVSISSAKNVYESLNKDRYDIHLCYISKDGTKWILVDSFTQLAGPLLTPNLGRKSFMAKDNEINIDIIFPILHGKHGEDGEVQGLAELLHIPCVGPSLIGAAVSMDKDVTKRLLRDAKIPVVAWEVWQTSHPKPDYTKLSKSLGNALFVEPSNAGSSVGASKVQDEDEFEAALLLAASHDNIVLIEQAVTGREIEVAVIGTEKVRISIPGEVIPEESFYSYDAKYAKSSTAHIEIPAHLDQQTRIRIKEYAESAYRAVRGRGMARVDFFVTSNNTIYLNEINSIPGFTDVSMYPQMWQYDGLAYSDLLDELITLARL